jgi:hypothetical protein
MEPAFKKKVEQFVEARITDFHNSRLAGIESLKLLKVLDGKNPYLFRTKNFETAPDLIEALLDARISSAEEGLFGSFLEALAIFVSVEKCGGQKSSTTGIDIELVRGGIRYLIAVKSGKSWSNSSSMREQKANFVAAVRVLKQNKGIGPLQPTLGICYGRSAISDSGAFLRIYGKDFWELISGEPELYKEIIEPIGYRAKDFVKEFDLKRAHVTKRMVREFTESFCLSDGQIDWQSLVAFVSKNREPRRRVSASTRTPRR